LGQFNFLRKIKNINEKKIHAKKASEAVYALAPVDVSVKSASGIARKLAAAMNPQNLVIIPISE
jgi:hypothetical protein